MDYFMYHISLFIVTCVWLMELPLSQFSPLRTSRPENKIQIPLGKKIMKTMRLWEFPRKKLIIRHVSPLCQNGAYQRQIFNTLSASFLFFRAIK